MGELVEIDETPVIFTRPRDKRQKITWKEGLAEKQLFIIF